MFSRSSSCFLACFLCFLVCFLGFGETHPIRVAVSVGGGDLSRQYQWAAVPVGGGDLSRQCPWAAVPVGGGDLSRQCPWEAVPVGGGDLARQWRGWASGPEARIQHAFARLEAQIYHTFERLERVPESSKKHKEILENIRKHVYERQIFMNCSMLSETGEGRNFAS